MLGAPSWSSILLLALVTAEAGDDNFAPCGLACGEAENFEDDSVAMLHLSMRVDHTSIPSSPASHPTFVDVSATGGVDKEQGSEKDSAEEAAAEVPATHEAAAALAVAVGTSGAPAPAEVLTETESLQTSGRAQANRPVASSHAKAPRSELSGAKTGLTVEATASDARAPAKAATSVLQMEQEVVFLGTTWWPTFFVIVLVVLWSLVMAIRFWFPLRPDDDNGFDVETGRGKQPKADMILGEKMTERLDKAVDSVVRIINDKAAPDTKTIVDKAPTPKTVAEGPEARRMSSSEGAPPRAVLPSPPAASAAKTAPHPGARNEVNEILAIVCDLVGAGGEEDRRQMRAKIKAATTKWSNGGYAPGRQQDAQREPEQELVSPTSANSGSDQAEPCDPEPEPNCFESQLEATCSTSLERIHARMRSGTPFKRPWELEHNIGAAVDAASEGSFRRSSCDEEQHKYFYTQCPGTHDGTDGMSLWQ